MFRLLRNFVIVGEATTSHARDAAKVGAAKTLATHSES